MRGCEGRLSGGFQINFNHPLVLLMFTDITEYMGALCVAIETWPPWPGSNPRPQYQQSATLTTEQMRRRHVKKKNRAEKHITSCVQIKSTVGKLRK